MCFRSVSTSCSTMFKKTITSAGVCCKSLTMSLNRDGEYRSSGLTFNLQYKKPLK